MFLTSEYLEKRNKYKTLKTELSTALAEHSSYLEQLETTVSSAEGKFSGVSTKEGIPNADTLSKTTELMEELQALSKKLSSRNESLSSGISTAESKYQYYDDLYQAEKKREDEYHQEIARQTMEKIRKQQEAMKNNQLIPR